MNAATEWSMDGLHEALWRRIHEHPKGIRPGTMIDVACGPGEFVSRFSDVGWTTAACDGNAATFAGRAGRFVPCDLNGDWPALFGRDQFDVVVAQEIIEHIESPPAFLRQLAATTRPGGLCVVTSPNNQDKASRIDYLYHGELPWFRLDQIHTNGHLTPIGIPLMYLFAITAGLELEAFNGFGSRAPLKLNWKGRWFERYLDRKMRGPCLNNVINIWLFRRRDGVPIATNPLQREVVEEAMRWYRDIPCQPLPRT